MFDIFNPRAEDINIEDIAHSLALQCRFNGHTKQFYSVAEHSINCARLAAQVSENPLLILTALLHDAHEAYLGDLPGPWRNNLYFIHDNRIIALSDLARTIDLKITTALNIPEPNERYSILGAPLLIKRFDQIMLYNERRLAIENQQTTWENLTRFTPRPNELLNRLEFLAPSEAVFMFLKIYTEIRECLKHPALPCASPLLSLEHLRT